MKVTINLDANPLGNDFTVYGPFTTLVVATGGLQFFYDPWFTRRTSSLITFEWQNPDDVLMHKTVLWPNDSSQAIQPVLANGVVWQVTAYTGYGHGGTLSLDI